MAIFAIGYDKGHAALKMIFPTEDNENESGGDVTMKRNRWLPVANHANIIMKLKGEKDEVEEREGRRRRSGRSGGRERRVGEKQGRGGGKNNRKGENGSCVVARSRELGVGGEGRKRGGRWNVRGGRWWGGGEGEEEEKEEEGEEEEDKKAEETEGSAASGRKKKCGWQKSSPDESHQ